MCWSLDFFEECIIPSLSKCKGGAKEQSQSQSINIVIIFIFK